ncbi:MAG: Ig-like domain-containing protein, partial [Clostridia bacterium]
DGAQHGTCVAGIIVDCTPNLNVKILPVRVTNDKGYGTVMSIGNGIGYAIEKGVAVINLSMNCQESAYVKMMLDKAAEKGIKVVVAAGNASADCSATFPANRATCVTVSSIGASMAKTGESNYGATVDFCAPGDNVTCYLPGGGSILRHGTSFAAPHISAILAMIALDNRSISLKDYCTDLGSVGRDPNYGWGLPDLTKLATHAVTEIQITTPINKMICASSAYLNFSVLPESATDRTVEAISDKSGVLRVIETAGGYVAVESVGPGVAELTIRARDGSGVTAKRKITVVQKVSSITISGGNTELHVGKSLQLSAEVLPTDATERGITWSTSNGTVATVSNDGLVTGIADGAVTITATAKDGYKACGTCALTVKTIPDPTQVEIICGQDKLTVNQIIQLKAKVLPEDAPQAVTWRIGTGADIATISETGLLTVTGSGTISVEARSATKDGVFNYRVFTAIQLPESISIAGNHNIRVGGTTTLAATVLPATASDKSITWSSSNAGIATVSEGGIVTGVAKGDVTIWATSKVDTKIQQGFSIKVAPKTFEVVFNATGGNCGTSNMTATCGQPLGTLPVPTRDYYTFGGWYTAASGGTEVNASSGFERADTLQLYAHWTEKKQSDWVLSSEAPRDSKIVDTKWRYTENTASTSASMSGWVLSGSDWKQVASGSFKYTSFPEGFDKSNWFYRTYHRPAYGTYENASEKRVASTSWTSYVYWHWMHDCGGSGAADRTILYYEGWGTNALTGPGDNFYYKNFGSFESTNTYSGGDVNWGQDDTLYAWYWGTGRSSYEESQGTYYWYRTPIYKCDYIDYARWYQYTRECESASEPTASSTISGIVKYVKYQEK